MEDEPTCCKVTVISGYKDKEVHGIATLVQFGACRPNRYYDLEMACDRLNPDDDMEIRFRSGSPK